MLYVKTKYKTHLESEYWVRVKRKIKLRDNFTCVIGECGKQTKLSVHHITYQVYGFSIVGSELQYLDWLILLCETCHHEVHKDKSHKLHPKNPFRMNVIQFKEYQRINTIKKK